MYVCMYVCMYVRACFLRCPAYLSEPAQIIHSAPVLYIGWAARIQFPVDTADLSLLLGAERLKGLHSPFNGLSKLLPEIKVTKSPYLHVMRRFKMLGAILPPPTTSSRRAHRQVYPLLSPV